MLKPMKLLIVEDSEDDTELLVMEVQRGGYDPVWTRVDTAETMQVALQNQAWDVVIGDYCMPQFDGMGALSVLQTHASNTPFIMVSGSISDKAGTDAMRNGARDYLMKSNLSRLVPTIEREIYEAKQHSKQMQTERELQRSKGAVNIARRIQQQLLPAIAPQLEGFDIAGTTFPAEVMGGDYFDFLPLADSSLAIVIGDASGHGIGPALLMAEARTCLHTLILEHEDIATILSEMNRILFEATPAESFLTLLLARLEPQTRRLWYTSAGHPGYILGSDGSLRKKLKSSGLPLGLFDDSEYSSEDPIDLEPGELLLLTTDGTTEAMSPDGTLLGSKRALQMVRENQHLPAREIAQSLYDAVRDYTQNSQQEDDMTTVIAKVTDPKPDE